MGPGGLERLLVSFASLADHDRFHFQAAYLLPRKDHLVRELTARGVTVTCLRGPHAADPRWVLRLLELVRRERIDVVHFHSPVMAAFARPALKTLPAARRPAQMGTEHNVWTSHRTPTRWANQATLPLQQITLAVSEQVRNSMPPKLAEHTEVLIHGVDVEAIAARRGEREEARAQFGLAPDELVVVTVANLRANKDYPTMLRAARTLVDDGLPVRFLSVGQGPLEEEIVAERDRLDLADRFRFLGYQSDPIRVLVAADVFCLSSRYEGLPIALLEALAAGLPVAVTDVGGVSSVVSDGQEGRLTPAGEPKALAESITAVANGAARRRHAGAALSRASRFGMRNAVDRQQQLYEQLIRH